MKLLLHVSFDVGLSGRHVDGTDARNLRLLTQLYFSDAVISWMFSCRSIIGSLWRGDAIRRYALRSADRPRFLMWRGRSGQYDRQPA